MSGPNIEQTLNLVKNIILYDGLKMIVGYILMWLRIWFEEQVIDVLMRDPADIEQRIIKIVIAIFFHFKVKEIFLPEEIIHEGNV